MAIVDGQPVNAASSNPAWVGQEYLNQGATSTVSSTTPYVLTATSDSLQIITGSAAQPVNLPNATLLVVGRVFRIINDSSASATVRYQDATTLLTLEAGTMTDLICTSIATANGTWNSKKQSGSLPVPIAQGGTGATTSAAGFAALAPAPGGSGNVMTSNGSAWVSNPATGSASVSTVYNVVIGSAAQVTAGTANFSSFGAYTPADGDRVLILPAYATTESVTLTKKLLIHGLGNTTTFNGTITLNTGASYSYFQGFRMTGNFVISSGVVGCFVNGIWFSGSNTFSDANTTIQNYLIGMQE